VIHWSLFAASVAERPDGEPRQNIQRPAFPMAGPCNRIEANETRRDSGMQRASNISQRQMASFAFKQQCRADLFGGRLSADRPNTITSPLEGEWIMSQGSGQGINAAKQDLVSSIGLPNSAKSNLTKLAAWISDRNIPFLVTSIGMIVMLLWAGSYKMTAPGAEGIIPLVSNSPLISWHFRLFGPYIGSDIIGLTEIAAAILIIAGYVRPKAGIIGGFITTLMFFVTSTMVVTTPGAVIAVHGMRYMSFLGLFLFKDVISLGVSFYLISYFGKKAIFSENNK
jgi:uncharacterized membrane protein YkgB